LINFFHRHARGRRSKDIPHACQMMLFWVGVGLTAGFHGTNAQTLRTTVLVVVVLTVVMFGGTIRARMLKVLGIWTGVEDDRASSSDNDEPLPIRGGARWQHLADGPQHTNLNQGYTRWSCL
jgi:sodium/hydrogen exchanger-like protein 6/7